MAEDVDETISELSEASTRITSTTMKTESQLGVLEGVEEMRECMREARALFGYLKDDDDDEDDEEDEMEEEDIWDKDFRRVMNEN